MDHSIFPKQRLSYKEKVKENRKWAKSTIDHLLLNYATDHSINNTSGSSYQRKLANYQLYNNILNQNDFERETNPLGIEVGQFKDEIQPYNKTYNKIQVLLGEELKRPFNYRTVLTNSDAIQSKLEHKRALLRQFLQTSLSMHINDVMERFYGETLDDPQAMQQQMTSLVPPEKLDQYMSMTYRHAKEHTADVMLQYLVRQQNIQEKKNDSFKHGLIAGEEFVWVGVINGEPVIEILNPLGVFYHKSPEVKYIQDGMYAGYRTFMTVGDILDRFSEDLSQKDIEAIEGNFSGVNAAHENWVGKEMKYPNTDVYETHLRNFMNSSSDEGSFGKAHGDDWLVQHVEWRSQKKVGFVRYLNDYGDEQLDIVSEEFEIPDYAVKRTDKDEYGHSKTYYDFDGMELEWTWIPEVWEGVRIGEDIYCCIGPKKYQYRSMDNPKRVALGYHGLIYNNMNADSVSLMDRMKPFQYLYFIVAHKLKKLIAKDRGKLFHFDVTMVPEELGLEKTMYYLQEMDIDFYNPLKNAEKPGIHQRSKVTTATDRSNMQHIMNYVQLMAALDDQISEVAGVTRQREGQTRPSERVTNAQQDLAQSATITEAAYFQPHLRLWEQVLNSLLQCAATCWKYKSIKKQFVLDDLSIKTLDMQDDFWENADFGVFVSNAAKDNMLFDELRALAQPLLQNDKAKFTDIIALFKATSAQDLERKIEDSERRFEEQQMQQIQMQQQAQMQSVQEQMAAQREIQEDQQAHELELQRNELDAKMRIEMLKATGQAAKADADNAAKQRAEVSKAELEREKLKETARQKELDRRSKNNSTTK